VNKLSWKHFGLVFTVICLLITGSVPFLLATNKTSDSKVAIGSVANLPALVKGAFLTNDAGRHVSVLHYTLHNSSEEPLQKFQVIVYIKDSYGQIKGGESWVDHSLVEAGEFKNLSNPLGHYVEADQNILVVLKAVSGVSMAWDAPAALSHAEVIAGRATAGPIPAITECPPNFCQTYVQVAREVCTNGVKSYSCDALKCTVTFTCN